MAEKNNSSQRILGLDFFRTLAIIGVTAFHMFSETLPGTFFSVPLFFVLSGYLLAFTCERARLEEKFSLLGYYLKRLKRIYPSLIIVLLTSVGVYYFLAPKIIEAIRPEVLSVILGYNNWWQIEQNSDYFARMTNTSPFTHLWFLGIELQYYFVWPVIFFAYEILYKVFGQRVALSFMAILAAASAAIMPMMFQNHADITRLYYGTDTRVHALLFGAVFGLARANKISESTEKSSGGLWKYFIFVAGMGIIFVSCKFVDGQSSWVYQGGMAAMSLLFCLMIFVTADEKINLGKFLERPIFRWIGKYSYGIFLWQYPVIFLFSWLGWTDLPFAPIIQLATIIILSVWSEEVSASLTRKKFPVFGSQLVFAKRTIFLAFTLFGAATMLLGFRGIAESADVKPVAEELKARLEANKSELDEQNRQAYEAQKIQPEPAEKIIDLNGATCIGDSIMLASSNEIRQVLPNCYIDAEVSRHIEGGIGAAENFAAQGKLGNIIVVGLGTNGSVEELSRYKTKMTALIDYFGPERQIFWININYPPTSPYLEWQETNNNYVREMENTYPNFHGVNWHDPAAQHPEWFVDDGIHPTEEGAKMYAQIVRDRIVEVLSARQ